jgi:multidrug resistance efflux pump
VNHFSRTRRFVRRQRLRGQFGVVVALVALFSGWMVWLVRGTVSLYVVSQRARLEVQNLPVWVQAPVDGQVTFADVALGRRVERGDVLLKLDTNPFELRRAELEVAIRSGTASLDALRDELATEQEVREAVALVAKETSRTAAARIALDQRNLAFKQKESEIAERLREATAISGLDALHTTAGAETQRAQVLATAAQAALDTTVSTKSLREIDARLASARISIAQAEAEVAKWKAQVDTLDYDIERRTVRAPVAGALADVMSVSTGMTVTSQERIATILPPGPLRVVAFFAPQESIGRVRPGQTAMVRLDSFPWAQFGTVAATVSEVGQEPRDGAIRVELAVRGRNPAIPLEHGLTGSCEVEVERTSPIRLLLRSMAHATSPEPQSADDPGSRVARSKGGP